MPNKTNAKTWLVMGVILGVMVGTAGAEVIYVDDDASGSNDGSSWTNAYNYLQDALYKPPTCGDQIWVAAGTYKPDEDEGGNVTAGDRTATFQLINCVALYGGFPDSGNPNWNDRDPNQYETILSGDLLGNDGPGEWENNDDNSYHVVTGSGTDETAILDGFTITGGYANGYGACPGCTDHGGGMFNWFGSPTVNNCTFRGNSAKFGSGMYNGSYSSPEVTSCTFCGNVAKGASYSSNSGGAGMANDDHSSPHLTNCSFRGNWAVSGSGKAWGGGLANWSSCDPSLINCTFTANRAVSGSGEAWGGGMNNSESSPILTNCRFNGNDANDGGGMFNDSGDPSLTNCTFSGNLAVEGGGMYNDRGSMATLKNCTFSGNLADDGAGMCNEQSYPNLTNCTFSGNQAGDEGGAMYNKRSSNPKLINCLFIVNSAYVGGGISNNISSSTVINCTFSGNQAADYGGGIDNVGWCRPILANCILWGDTPEEIYVGGGGNAVVTYSDVQGGWPGEGNIDQDPLFVDPNGPDNDPGTEDDNLRLLAGSPCIDAGDNTAVPGGVTTDLDGHPRFLDDLCTTDTGNGTPPIVDMGAYEFAYAYLGDFDGDCVLDVDLVDFAIFALAWLTEPGDAQWNPDCDIGIPPDSHIDWRDLDVFTDNWLLGL